MLKGNQINCNFYVLSIIKPNAKTTEIYSTIHYETRNTGYILKQIDLLSTCVSNYQTIIQ